jgi:transforming growth factor-beta-induced protein
MLASLYVSFRDHVSAWKLELIGALQILAPNNDAFDKIPYSVLNDAFKNNDQDTITNVIEYHILQGTRVAAQLIPGTPVFIPTLLTSPEWSNVTGGQKVENVKQAGDVVVFVSGQGSRSTLVQAVRSNLFQFQEENISNNDHRILCSPAA